MRLPIRPLAPFALVVPLLLLVAAPISGQLLDYVQRPDDSFEWSVRREVEPVPGVHCIELRMTSQTWKGVTWKHELFAAYSTELGPTNQGVEVVSGGSWSDQKDRPPDAGGDGVSSECRLAGMVVPALGLPILVVNQVPFQPIFDERREDALIAYTFDKFLETNDPDWPLLLPMTKSAVRAMDVFQAFADKQWGLDLEAFLVTGGSKRGWTTWLTGAVDERVNAIAPMVIDTLNMQVQMEHQITAWGAYSDEISDYSKLDLQARMRSADGRRLTDIVDPFSYRHLTTMPKMILIATNDPYWPLDALNLYYDDLVGEKHIVYVPNVGHGIEEDLSRVVSSVAAMGQAAAGNIELPVLDWQLIEDDGGLRLRIESGGEPTQVSAWIASSPTRDFREAEWQPTTLAAVAGNAAFYEHYLERPKSGYAAMYGEVRHTLKGRPFYQSTQLEIVQGAAAGLATGVTTSR